MIWYRILSADRPKSFRIGSTSDGPMRRHPLAICRGAESHLGKLLRRPLGTWLLCTPPESRCSVKVERHRRSQARFK